MNLSKLSTLLEHSVQIHCGYFGANRSIDDLPYSANVLVKIDFAFLCDQRRVCCDTVKDTHACCFANLFEARSINKEFHIFPLSIRKDLQMICRRNRPRQLNVSCAPGSVLA